MVWPIRKEERHFSTAKMRRSPGAVFTMHRSKGTTTLEWLTMALIALGVIGTAIWGLSAAGRELSDNMRAGVDAINILPGAPAETPSLDAGEIGELPTVGLTPSPSATSTTALTPTPTQNHARPVSP